MSSVRRGCATDWTRRRRALAWAAAYLAMSCGNPTGVDRTPTVVVASVSVNPPATSVVVGTALALQAAVMDANGNPLSGEPIVWTVRDANIATVSDGGVVTGLAVGSTQVAANVAGRSGVATITVVPVPVASVTVSPAPLGLVVGQSATLAVVTADAKGAPLAGRSVSWTSDNPSVATVSAAGAVTAIAVGTATIKATSEGVVGSAIVTVTAIPVRTVAVKPGTASLIVGESTTFTATPQDAGGAPLLGRVVTWTTSDVKVATVTNAGVVTAVGAGSATITALSEGQTGTATVTVGAVPVASVLVEPAAPTVMVGQTATLTATVKDAAGNILAGRGVTWSSSNPLAATVSSAGVVNGVAPGSATISATVDGRSGSAAVIVTLVPVASVAVQPKSPSLFVGGTVTLAAVVTDANGAVTNRVVTWASDNPPVATVSSTTGVVTAVAPGHATITATSEGKTDAAVVSVAPAPVGSVVVLPANSALVVGQTAPLAATVTDTRGVVVTDRPVAWTSSNNSVATVSAAGLVTAVSVSPSPVTITATSENQSGTAIVSVAAVPVGSVTVAPTSASVFVAQTTTLTATVRDANGTVVADRPVTWSSDNPLVATVSPSGVVGGVASGTATITATVGGKSGSSQVTVSLVPVGSVAVQILSSSLTVGQTTTATALVKDANGVVVSDRVVSWSSSNPAVATVSTTGAVTAVAPGTATITATSEGVSSGAPISVAPSPVGSVVVSPANSSIAVGQTTPLTATVKDSRGIVVTDRTVVWTSSSDAVATVSPTGVVTAVSVGSVTITATSEGKSGAAAVAVTAVPVLSVTVAPTTLNLFVAQTAVLAATVRDANNTVVTDRPITWTSSSSVVATVSPTGVVTALAPGSATISASAGGKSGSATVIVTLVPVGSVVLAPASATVIAGQTTTLVPTIRDANGAIVTNRAVSWTTSNPAVATVSSSGVVTAVAPGGATITATSEGQSGNAAITVIPVPVGSVTVSPSTSSLVIGATTGLVATVKDANGTVVTNRVVTWSTSDPLVATVSSAGVVTAVGVGTATVTATSEGQSGSSAVTVTPVPVASVTVQPPTMALQVGQTATATAVLKDANGNLLTGRVVTWISNNPLVATVSSTGVVTGVAPGGPVFVTASSEGWNGSTSVTVTAVPVGSVTLPATTTLVAGQSTTLVPIVKDANGVVVTDRVVTWTSSNPAVATVTSAGVVKALVTGTATITATSETKSGATALTVTPAAVGSVTLAPLTTTIASGSTVTLVATVKDVNGTTVTDRPITWTSSDDLVATVSASGVVTALATGTATISATSESKTGTATVTVTAGPAASITVTPAPATVKNGLNLQLTATAKDANGNTITGRSFAWSSSNTGVATVTSTGQVRTKAAGTTTITAAMDSSAGTSLVTVTP